MLNFKRSFLSVLAIFFIVLTYFPFAINFDASINQVEHFQETFIQKEGYAFKRLNQLIEWDKKGNLALKNKGLADDFNSHGVSFFIYSQNKVRYWSEDATDFDKQLITGEELLIHTKNAWQYKLTKEVGNVTYVALILLKNEFAIENTFLENKFQQDFIFSSIEDVIYPSQDLPTIVNKAGQEICSLKLEEDGQTKSIYYFLFCLFLIGVFFLFQQFYATWRLKIQLRLLIAIVLWLIIFYFRPELFDFIPIFRPTSFAISTFIPSLGDLLLHSILLFYVSTQLVRLIGVKTFRYVGYIVFVFSVILNCLCISLIKLSIESSQVNFDLNNLFQLDYYSLLALLSIALIIYSSLHIHRGSLHLIRKKMGLKGGLKALLILGALIVVISYSIQIDLIYLWFLPLSILFYYEEGIQKVNSLALIIVFLIYLSAIHAFLLNQGNQEKEKIQRSVIIKKLAEEKDPIAEYLFPEIQRKLVNDANLIQVLESYWEKKEEVDQYINDTYFNGYWEKYQVNITYCDLDDSLYVNDWNASVSCITFFQDRIRQEGDIVSANNLFQLQNLAGRTDYICEIPLLKANNGGKLFVELSSKIFNENEGYPELLIDESSSTFEIDLKQYSYAVYNNGELIFKNGNFNYSTKLRINELFDNSYYQYRTKSFQHLAYQKDKHITIILSKEQFNLFDFFTSVAYLLILYSLLFIFLSVVAREFIFDNQINPRDFTIKVQLFLILSLLSALLLLALGTTYYIKDQYKIKNANQLEEKIRSVNIELENKIASEEFLSNGLQDIVQLYLVKFSNVFYSDINLYDKNGMLYSSSRPEIFEKGLKSNRMHPKAFQELIINEKAEWVQSEKIGELSYLSAYIPFKNYDNELLGYLNLPYFARQGELENEISSFLVSAINIYIGIFVLTLLISVLLANQLSKPLLLIRQQIGKLKLGSSIELIEWNSQDEIGALVKEYNRIAIELSESAERLAQSEREGAWKEMAKQVAHEIKNPLTPMKLSIQHLQRAAESQSDDLTERIERTTKTVIEQIETLTNIASAFSTFAQLPEKVTSDVDLSALIKNAVDLYSTDVDITLTLPTDNKNYIIKADKDQLLRLFNNLIKNAIQATESTDIPKIDIVLNDLLNHYQVQVIDNGVGINKEQMENIFEPNFTTKSSGTGLGLAMSKNIVEQMGGELSVNSKINEGATFTITFPIG